MSALGALGVAATAVALALGDTSERFDRAADAVAERAATAATELAPKGPGDPANLPPRRLAGQRLIAGWDGVPPPPGLRAMIRRGEVAGVILFADNITGRAATARTIAELQAIPRPVGLEAPLLVMTDQEGGQVARIAGPPSASAQELRAGGTEAVRAEGLATAELLRSHGINTDLAPVLDIERAGGAIDREQRAFGTDAATVIATGVDGFAAGLREGGVNATAKHFPGIGRVTTNTDFAAQRIQASAEELRATDEVPFGAFVAAGGELVMLSLATYPAFADRPAAFSRAIVTGELRGRLGFGGVTITDGLGAAAAQAFGTEAEIALASATAGNDLLLYSDWRRARDAGGLLADRLAEDKLDRDEFVASVRRVLALREDSAG